MVRDSTGKPHAWDLRADWLADDPVCSAIMTRSYRDSFEVPAWFFNLPPPDDAVVRDGFPSRRRFPMRRSRRRLSHRVRIRRVRSCRRRRADERGGADRRAADEPAEPGRHEIRARARRARDSIRRHACSARSGASCRRGTAWRWARCSFPLATMMPPSRARSHGPAARQLDCALLCRGAGRGVAHRCDRARRDAAPVDLERAASLAVVVGRDRTCRRQAAVYGRGRSRCRC